MGATWTVVGEGILARGRSNLEPVTPGYALVAPAIYIVSLFIAAGWDGLLIGLAALGN